MLMTHTADRKVNRIIAKLKNTPLFTVGRVYKIVHLSATTVNYAVYRFEFDNGYIGSVMVCPASGEPEYELAVLHNGSIIDIFGYDGVQRGDDETINNLLTLLENMPPAECAL